MGVTGLWKLIEPCGQAVPVETLENKILAVDISIWLHQVVKGFQDNKGSALANSHLLGLFHRLCKLLYFRVKPIFVFDGKVAPLKRDTIAKRNQKKNKLHNEAERIQTLLLQSLAKEKVVQQALGSKATEELLKASPLKNRIRRKDSDDDIFKLPDIPTPEQSTIEISNDNLDQSCCSESDNSYEERKHHPYSLQNLQAIDVKSEHFRKIPVDIRHDILIDIKETRKQSSWGKLNELPSKSNEFSSLQIQRLLKRRQVQESIEEVQKEMDGTRTHTLNELENILNEEGIIETSSLSNTKHISSDSNTRYLLLRDLKETLIKAATASESNKNTKTVPKVQKMEDEDIEMALKISLDNSFTYKESDYNYTGNCKLNSVQRSELKNSIIGLARDYMIEHAGMNNDDVKNLLESTQIDWHDEINNICSSQEKKHTLTTDFVLTKADEKQNLNAKTRIFKNNSLENVNRKNEEDSSLNSESNEKVINEIDIMSDSNTDSELEEVVEIPTLNASNDNLSKSGYSNIEIFIDATKPFQQDDDIFSECFKTIKEPKICEKSEPTPLCTNVSEVLEDLKKQALEATRINLSDIKLDKSVIEISDDETSSISNKCLSYDSCDCENSVSKYSESKTNEVIETFNTSEPKSYSSPETLKGSGEYIEIIDKKIEPASSTKLTPSKTKDISEFFENKFVIKRTPDKNEEKEIVTKMTSPFFIRKSQKNSNDKTPRKRNSTSQNDFPTTKSRKINKTLFSDNVFEKDEQNVDEQKDAFEVAAKVLKENKSVEELQGIASKLAKERLELETERNRQDRMGMSITEKMNSECMELLRLFGIPYIVAPMEAEAQCAFLDINNLTNGTITDDSDIWLFGGTTVYKNFFAQNKHVIEFKYEKIKSAFNVNRNKLVQLALLVGSDYTTGINGIGAVTALEILATFSPKELPEVNVEPSQQASIVLKSLLNFREWWTNTKSNGVIIGSSMRKRLRNKLANIDLCREFPSSAVVEAYLKPKVDESKNSFLWGTPDVESIREFARTNFGWTRNKTDEILGPVIKKLNEKNKQSTIKNYFSTQSVSYTKQLKVSKRVQDAINSMSSDFKSNEGDGSAKQKSPRKKLSIAATSSSGYSISDITEKKKKSTIKNNNATTLKSLETIPQREKDQKEMKEKKKHAAATLRQIKKNLKQT